jgi:hypothetical protein
MLTHLDESIPRQPSVRGYFQRRLLLTSSECTRSEKPFTPLPINNIANVINQEGVRRFNVDNEIDRFRRGEPELQLVEANRNRYFARACERFQGHGTFMDTFQLEPDPGVRHMPASPTRRCQVKADVQRGPVALVLHEFSLWPNQCTKLF